MRALRSYPAEGLDPYLARILRSGVFAGLIALAVFIGGGLLAGFQQFFRSYLFAYMFWLELSLGSLAVVLLHYLVGGGWGLMIRRILEAAAKNIWLLALLFAPLALGVMHLYPWAQPEVVAGDPILQHRALYLNLPFFLARAVVYFAVWILLALRLTRWSYYPERSADPDFRSRLQRSSAFGLIAYGLTMSFAAIDWLMALDPHWYSTIYSVLIVVGQLLAGLTFAIGLTPFAARHTRLGEVINRGHYRDLGALLLSFVLIWAYIAFSQYIIIWWANLPHEVTWYLNRSEGGWLYPGLLVFVVQFILPFMVLLSLWAKSNPRVLSALAGVILLARLIDYFWHVAPAFHPARFSIHWMDFLAPLAIGGVWAAGFAWHLRRTPLLLPLETPAVESNEGRGDRPAIPVE